MYAVVITIIIACIMLLFSVYICIYAMRNMQNDYVRRIKDEKYITGRVDDKVTSPDTSFFFKKYCVIVNQRMYYLPADEYKRVDVGKNYIYVLSDEKNQILKVVKDLKLYEHEITMKDVIKDTKIYKHLKSSYL